MVGTPTRPHLATPGEPGGQEEPDRLRGRARLPPARLAGEFGPGLRGEPLGVPVAPRRRAPGNQGTPVPAALFMVQGKSECHFSNGTQQVRFLDRYIYNREEQVRFDSLVGEYRARTEMGQPAAERWNRWPDALQRARAALHDFCASNYEFFASLTVQRRGEPGWG